jgi:hypothetical protein
MSRLFLGILVIGALLVATNPSRTDFNTWAQSFVAKKIEEEAIKRGENPNDGRREFGGAIVGFFVSNMPIDRQNYLLLSLYTIKLPNDNGAEKSCTFLGVAGQFIPTKGCDLNGSHSD